MHIWYYIYIDPTGWQTRSDQAFSFNCKMLAAWRAENPQNESEFFSISGRAKQEYTKKNSKTGVVYRTTVPVGQWFNTLKIKATAPTDEQWEMLKEVFGDDASKSLLLYNS